VTELDWDPGTVRAWKLITLVLWDMSLGMGGLVLGLLFFLAIVVAQQFWVVLAVWVLAAAGLCIPRPTRGLGSACSWEPS
jgi:hypothetical protein